MHTLGNIGHTKFLWWADEEIGLWTGFSWVSIFLMIVWSPGQFWVCLFWVLRFLSKLTQIQCIAVRAKKQRYLT